MLKLFPFILSMVLTCFTRLTRLRVLTLNLFPIRTLLVYNHLVFENRKDHMFCFLTMLQKNLFDTDRWMLLKHVYRVGSAANHQSSTVTVELEGGKWHTYSDTLARLQS